MRTYFWKNELVYLMTWTPSYQDYKYIGCVNLCGIEFEHNRVSASIYLRSDCRSKGYGTRAMQFTLSYAAKELSCHNVIVCVSDGQRGFFYLIFYGCFIVSGIFIAVFYRMTEYNRASSYGWLIFGLKYDLLLWTPIVLIMIIFGTEVLPTVMYSLLFLICILGVSWMNGKLLK